jgi:hypothetical protein
MKTTCWANGIYLSTRDQSNSAIWVGGSAVDILVQGAVRYISINSHDGISLHEASPAV